MKAFTTFSCALLLAVAVSACSGGGSDDPVPAPPPTVTPPTTTSAPPSVELPVAFFGNAGEQIEITATATDDIGIGSYLWEQLSGDPTGIANVTLPTLSVDVPQLSEGQDVEFRVTVTDAQSQSASATTTLTINPFIASMTPATLTVESVDGIVFDDPDEPLVLVAGRMVKPISAAGTLSIEVPSASALEPMALAKRDGTPLLMTFMGTDNGEIELSIETSADAFTMRSPRFFGVTITDKAELSRRIRAHSVYPDLLRAIRRKIGTSTQCPMSQACNASAARYSEQIAQDLDLDGVVSDGD